MPTPIDSLKLKQGWDAPRVTPRGERMLRSDSPVMDFLTRAASGYLLPPAKLDNQYNILTPRRPAAPIQFQQPSMGIPMGLLNQLAYMNPGAQPVIGAAQQSLYDPRVYQQLSPQVLQLLRQL